MASPKAARTPAALVAELPVELRHVRAFALRARLDTSASRVEVDTGSSLVIVTP